MKKIVLLRHGQSQWNLENRLSGWTDVDLSEEGYKQAIKAGIKIKIAGLEFDIVFTSVLKRAIKTCNIVLEESGQLWIPIVKTWRLNERHYGSLQGSKTNEEAEEYSNVKRFELKKQYDSLPPLLESRNLDFNKFDRRYLKLPKDSIPLGESLKGTMRRVIPFWIDILAPAILDNKAILIVAHGDLLRALLKHIGTISDDEIAKFDILTANPLILELRDNLSINKIYSL